MRILKQIGVGLFAAVVIVAASPILLVAWLLAYLNSQIEDRREW